MFDDILKKNQYYLVAVSGGPDSMALMDMLLKRGYSFEIAHVNYHHRKEADYEETMITSLANKNNIKIHKLDAYYDDKGNFEDWARETRYTFFSKICKESNLDGCIVGHHLDDCIETYLMQLKRGYVNYFGLNAITTIKDINIYRPLLKYSKNELLSYLKSNNIPYSIDVTNADVSLLRNKIRHEKVNKMSEEEKNKIIEEINNKNIVLQIYQNKIDELLKKEYIFLDDLKSLQDELKERLIYTWVRKYVDKSFSKKRVLDIFEKVYTSNGNVWVHIDKNCFFVKEYDKLKITYRDSIDFKIVIDKPSIIDNEYVYFDLITDPDRFYIKNDSYPLTIENVKANDKVKIGSIKKSINRLLIDEKIPASFRLYWPKIVNNKGEIIFVPRKLEDDKGLFVVKNK